MGLASAARAGRAFVSRRPILINLAVLAAVYCIGYWTNPYLPGHRPAQPEGWFGWFDQGQYLRSSIAFAHGNFRAAEHLYPPLYPLLGAFSIPFTTKHPFFAPDLLLTLFFAGAFLAVAGRRLGSAWAAGVFWLSVLLLNEVYRFFIVPSTTILAAALLAALILDLDRGAGRPERCEPWDCARFSLIAFLLIPTRPPDALVSAPLCLFFLFRLFHTARAAAPRWGVADYARRIAGAGAGAAVGIAGYFGWNWTLSGSPLGEYGKAVAGAGGFQFGNLPDKLVALLLDSATVYGDRSWSLLGHYPWLIVVLIGLALTVWLGDGLLRSVAFTLALQFCLYASYADLLPIGMWRYHGIRYFSWFAPYALLLSAVALKLVRARWNERPIRYGSLAVTAVVVLACGIGFRAAPLDVPVRVMAPHRLQLENPRQDRIDFLSLAGLGGSFTEQHSGTAVVRYDDQVLAHVADFRIVPTDDAARIVLFRPIRSREIAIELDAKTPLAPDAAPRAFRRTFGWGWPRWLWAPPLPR